MEHLSSDGPYPLKAEADMLAGLVALAAARYSHRGQARPVNAVELGYWMEGARLGVWFVSQEGHQYPDGPWKAGYSERDGRAVFCQFFPVASWHLMLRPVAGRRVVGYLHKMLDIEMLHRSNTSTHEPMGIRFIAQPPSQSHAVGGVNVLHDLVNQVRHRLVQG